MDELEIGITNQYTDIINSFGSVDAYNQYMDEDAYYEEEELREYFEENQYSCIWY